MSPVESVTQQCEPDEEWFENRHTDSRCMVLICMMKVSRFEFGKIW